jgi:hypothetical protein
MPSLFYSFFIYSQWRFIWVCVCVPLSLLPYTHSKKPFTLQSLRVTSPVSILSNLIIICFVFSKSINFNRLHSFSTILSTRSVIDYYFLSTFHLFIFSISLLVFRTWMCPYPFVPGYPWCHTVLPTGARPSCKSWEIATNKRLVVYSRVACKSRSILRLLLLYIKHNKNHNFISCWL